MSYKTTYDIYRGGKLLKREVEKACFASTRDYPGLTHIIYYPTAPQEYVDEASDYIGMKYRDLQIWYLHLMEEFGFSFQGPKDNEADVSKNQDLDYCIDSGFRIDKRVCRRQLMAEATIIRHIQETPSILFALYEMFRLYPDLTTSLERKFAAFGVACTTANPLKIGAFNQMVELNSEHCLFPYSNKNGDIFGFNSVKTLLHEKSTNDSIASIMMADRLLVGPNRSWGDPVVEAKPLIEWIIKNVK